MTTPTPDSDKSRALLPLTVVILTYNEETALPDCLRSLSGRAHDVHVLDSGSNDATLQVAREFGIPVHFNAFTGFGDQRNWAIDNIPHAHDWVLHLDADERMTPELYEELLVLLAQPRHEAGFFVASKLMLAGQWLRYSSGFPVYQLRLFHRGHLRFENHGHGQREVTSGSIGYLHSPYLHEAFSKGLDDWFTKHARYARHEAEDIHRDRCSVFTLLQQLIGQDPVTRRRTLKSIAYRLPGRPTLRLLQLLIINRGLLDGSAGVVYARMMAVYESMINVHLSRIRSGIEA